MSDLDLLRSVGDRLVPPPLDTLRETARARDRRTARTGLAVASVVLLAIGGTTFLALGKDNAREPIHITPTPSATTTAAVRSTRPLTYADGATVHYGDQTVTAAAEVVELDLTDDGVVFRTSDNRIWFTDGSVVDRIGGLGNAGAAYANADVLWDNYAGRVVSGNSGSEEAWFEFPQPGAPDVVVYDTSAGAVRFRQALEVPSGTLSGLYAVTNETVYGFTDLTFGEGLWPNWRIDLATGTQQDNTIKHYQADLGSLDGARTLEVSEGQQPADFIPFDGIQQFAVAGGRVDARGEEPFHVRDALTRTELQFSAPAGYPRTDPVWLVQWLDDDTIVLQAAHSDRIDLLQCGISAGTCEVSASGPASIVVPEVKPSSFTGQGAS
jgi:hypothetical protein